MQSEHASTSSRDAELAQSRLVPSELFGRQTIGIGSMAVSYTHLTLPTSDLV